MTLIDRIAARLDVGGDDCWEWPGSKTLGYGTIKYRGVSMYVHRAVYEECVGPIPSGYQIDHLCRNRACSNPDHLEAVTQRENIARAQTKTHCLRGHAYDEENTETYANGRRRCRACHRDREREGSRRRRAALNHREDPTWHELFGADQ